MPDPLLRSKIRLFYCRWGWFCYCSVEIHFVLFRFFFLHFLYFASECTSSVKIWRFNFIHGMLHLINAENVIWIPGVEILMVLLGGVKLRKSCDLGHNLFSFKLLLFPLKLLLSQSLLLIIVVENLRSILRPLIVTLLVQRRRIMHREEHIKQHSVRYFIGIELDLHCFRMPCRPILHWRIQWILPLAPRIPHSHIHHALHPPKYGFHDPERPTCKWCDLLVWSFILHDGRRRRQLFGNRSLLGSFHAVVRTFAAHFTHTY